MKKKSTKGVMDGVPLTQEGVCQVSPVTTYKSNKFCYEILIFFYCTSKKSCLFLYIKQVHYEKSSWLINQV